VRSSACTMCCSVLQCVAVCVAGCCRVLQGVAVRCSVLQCVSHQCTISSSSTVK